MQEEKRLNQLKEGSSNGKHRNVLTSESSEGFTLATWVGANDAYVRTAYDQTGNAAGGCCYVERKLEMARDFPQESRLFANEILQGAPRIFHALHGPLKKLTDEKVALINSWADDGKINSVDPYHLIFSIWAITQHYADFDVQILAVMEKNKISNRFSDANKYLKELFTRLLEPKVKLKEPLS